MEDHLYTIIDKVSGQECRCMFNSDIIKHPLADNEFSIKELREEYMENPFFNFLTRTFYNKL